MMTGDFTHCKTLREFYAQIRDAHKDAHGADYCNVHDEIHDRIATGTHETYRELGVNQGATAAVALLAVPQKMRIYDIHLNRWSPYQTLFEDFAKANNVDFAAEQRSSLDYLTIQDVDLLYIDTVHLPAHLKKELNLHESSVSKTIVCHDTYAKPALHDVIEDFCKNNPWEITRRNRTSVGFTTIERIK